MTPLTLNSAAQPTPQTVPALLEMLADRPQPAVVWYGLTATEELERVELSGRVLQNWAVKLIGLLSEEVDLSAGDLLVIDARPHWKAAAVVLAGAALGCQVHLHPAAEPVDHGQREPGQPEQPDSGTGAPLEAALVVTDRPAAWASSDALGTAELAALSPGLLDESYEQARGEPLPGWVLDISADVRQHPDQLAQPLPAVDLPGPSGGAQQDTQDAVHALLGRPSALSTLEQRAQAWTRWRLMPWTTDAIAEMLASWAHRGTTVIADLPDVDAATAPAAETTPEGAWATLLINESVS